MREFFSLLVCVACAAFVSAQETAPKSLWSRKVGSDWPQMLGPERNGKSSEKNLLTKWPEKGLRVVWSRPVGTGYSVGSVAKGRFYQFDKVKDEATLVCLNAETGKELWKFGYRSSYEDLYGYNDGPRCAPLIDGNHVYLLGVEGMLHCLNATTGELEWKWNTSAEFGVIQNFFGVGSGPIIEGDLLLVMVGGSPPEAKRIPPGALNRVTPNGSAVVAFDKLTGEVRYKSGNDLASYSSLQTATIDGRRYAFAFCREGLLAFEPATGKQDFHYPWRAEIMESVNASTPVVIGNQVFLSECYGVGSSLLQIAQGNAKVVWKDDPDRRAKAMETHWNTPIYHEGFLYGSSGRHAGTAALRCIEAKSGKVQWSIPRLSRASLLYVDGHFIVLGEYGQLLLIQASPEKFDLVAQVDLAEAHPLAAEDTAATVANDPWWSAPILSHGLLYVRGGGQLICMEVIPE